MRINEFVSEANLPPKALQVLWRIRHGLNQPGLQLQQPISQFVSPALEPKTDITTPELPKVKRKRVSGDIGKFLDQSEYIKTQNQIKQLEKVLALAQKIEKLKERLEHTKFGMDRGTVADLERLINFPVPETDEDIRETLIRYEKAIDLLQNVIQRKRAIWR